MGAAYNQLMELETKESLAQMVCDRIDDIHALQEQVKVLTGNITEEKDEEKERKDLVYEIAKLFDKYYIKHYNLAHLQDVIGTLAAGQQICIGLRYNVLKYIKGYDPVLFDRLRKYIAPGFVKP